MTTLDGISTTPMALTVSGACFARHFSHAEVVYKLRLIVIETMATRAAKAGKYICENNNKSNNNK